MNIIYVSSLCSEKKFFKLFNNYSNMPGQQIQKYHRLLTEGFAMNDCEVNAVSVVPLTSQNNNKYYFSAELENINGVVYHYIPLLNLPILRNLSAVVGTILKCINLIKKQNENIIVCDALNISSALGALLVSKIFHVKSVAIVTDIPNDIFSSRHALRIKINNAIIESFDSYILLTKQMDKKINPCKKPSIILEGHVDKNMKYIKVNNSAKYENKVCIYAGMIQKKYGIKNLIEGFIKADIPGTELHIYGDGDYKNELLEICKEHENVKYFGTVPNNLIVEEELKATLLINPRPTSEEFTKYSFPSKNMEYMVSGTPVLTTNLPGMPVEYLDYVYLIEDESIDGIAKALTEVLNKSREELEKKGREAKRFVLQNKNNEIQAEKILLFLKRLSNDGK